jgi:hypothetical protein
MKIFYSFILLTLSLLIQAQTKPATYKDYFLEGSYLLIEGGDMDKAQSNFEMAYQLDSTSANINYMLGICYLSNPLLKTKAERYLEIAVKNISDKYKTDDASERSAPPLAMFYYGEALHVNYKFEEANAQYAEFKKTVDPKDTEYINMVEKEVSTTKVAKEIAAQPLNVSVTNLGDSINSPFPEYSAVLSADERMIIFTTRRPNTTGGQKSSDDKYFEDIVVAYKNDNGIWSKPFPLSQNVNTYGHEASINLTPDGQTLIVYRNDADDKNPEEGDGNIYYTTFDGKDWSPLKEFGSDVNTPFMETHACLSADGNVLFFSSERPGGFGGKDIYRCIKLPNMKWSKALNMGPLINTQYDEDGGFIHPDGQTFFFASNGPKSMGGYDIMFATLNEDNKFSDVMNIGYPINTTEDDIFYVTSPDGKRGYFSSAKQGGYGDNDIYRIDLAESKETFLALFRGQLIPAEGETLPDNIVIIVTDKTTNEIIGTYRPKLVNGTFSTILPPGREYNFSYQTDNNEEFYNEDLFVSNELSYQEIKREVSLEPVRLLGKIKVNANAITLDAIVLKDNRSKLAMGGSKLTLEEQGGVTQLFITDSLGKFNGIGLQPEKKYKLYAEFGGVKSASAEITTIGAKSARVINQVIYLNGTSEKFTFKELQLVVVVKHPKTKKPIPGAGITLTDADGKKQELKTDAKGIVKGIQLGPNTKYLLVAYKDGSVSEVETFTTGPISISKTYTETLYIEYTDSSEIAAAKAAAVRAVTTKTAISRTSETVKVLQANEFEFYYKYGRKIINENDRTWINFIDYIVKLSKKREVVTITIKSSASRVPTRAKGGNLRLAKIRANNLEKLILSSLKEKGVLKKQVKFVKTPIVGGPKYRGDYKVGRKKYEKHQYVKAKAK